MTQGIYEQWLNVWVQAKWASECAACIEITKGGDSKNRQSVHENLVWTKRNDLVIKVNQDGIMPFMPEERKWHKAAISDQLSRVVEGQEQ